VRISTRIGLNRRAKEIIPTLQSYIEAKSANVERDE
jgi:hypothetical protein